MDDESDKTISESEISEDSLDLDTIIEIENKELSPIDIDIQIQTERIVSILNEVFFKTELAIYLSDLKDEDWVVMGSIMQTHDYRTIKRIISKYTTNAPEGDLSDYILILEDQVQEIISHPKPKEHPELIQAICILEKYKELHPLIKNKIKKMEPPLPSCILYLESLTNLKNKMINAMTISAAEKLKKDLIQRNLNRINKIQKLKIADFTKKIKQEEHNFHRIFKHKDTIIKKHEEELNFLKSDCKDGIKKKILESEKKMLMATHVHEVHNEELIEKDTRNTEAYDNLLKDHLLHEKGLRAKRFKIETQLVSWLRKYDSEIGDKQSELDDLTMNYELEKKQLEELQERFDLQEEQYIPLMIQKEAEYQAALKIRVDEFIINRAARVFQRHWREILEARAERKRQKKAAKKKK